ncbi:polymorphic toxin-type HINT domain-containing protein [Methylosoma difficile]
MTTKTEQSIRLKIRQQPCFAAGTLVHTKEGLKPIEEIRIGDWMLSYSDNQHPPKHLRQEDEYTYRRVTQTLVTEDQPLSKLIVSDLTNNVRETIWVTADHPIYHKDRGWIPAAELDAVDGLVNFRFCNVMVFRGYHDIERRRVYNLKVEAFHTYYAGEQGIWVHNNCDIDMFPTRKTATIPN